MNGDVNDVIAVTQVGCVQSSITQPTCFELGSNKEAFLAPTQLGGLDQPCWSVCVWITISEFHHLSFMLHHPQVVNIWVIWITHLGNQLQKHICIEDTEGVGAPI